MTGETRHHPDCTCQMCFMAKFERMQSALKRISISAADFSVKAERSGLPHLTGSHFSAHSRGLELIAVEALK